jgi:hypothetical protein
MHYLLKYISKGGITERSEFLPFETDAEANAHARLELPRHFIVEVWKADALLTRTLRDPPEAAALIAAAAAAEADRANSSRRISH